MSDDVALAQPILPGQDKQTSAHRRSARGRRGGPAVTVLLMLAVVPVVAMAVLRALPDDGVTPIPQLVAYAPWMVLPAAVVTGACALARRWRLTAVAGICALALIAWLAPFYGGFLRSAPTVPGTDSGLRVLSANALYGRADAETIVALVAEHDVDVLVVLELTTDLRERLVAAGLEDLLPSRVDDGVGAGAGGTGIWATGALRDVRTSSDSTFAMPSATLDAGGASVRIHAVHPVPPVPGMTDVWHSELKDLAAQVGRGGATYEVYAGDFNAGYDHPSFRALLHDGFVDATRAVGRGTNPSWSWGGNGWFPVDLDHVVTNARVARVESLPVPGSDHRAILATLDLGT